MKKLEDIPKKEIFNTPDGYFDKLPTIIQARIDNESSHKVQRSAFRFALTYAMPAVIILVMAIWWLYPSSKTNQAEMLISKIETEDLIIYLNNEDITTNEIIESINFNHQEVENIEAQAYQLNMSDKELNTLYESEYY